MKNNIPVVILSAIAFPGVACFNNVHAWPLLVPLVAGMGLMMAGRSAAGRSFGSALRNGFYAALLVCIAGFPLLWYFATDEFRQRLADM